MKEQNAREWYFYRDLESLKVRVEHIDAKQLQITFQRSDGIEVGECLNCQEDEDSQLLSSVALYFYIEEIPRLIAILNDIYRTHYDTCVPFLKLDDEDDYGPLDDRLATLRAYKVIADQLHGHLDQLGFVDPLH